MAALTAARTGFAIKEVDKSLRKYKMAAVKIWKGSLVCQNAAGFAAPAADTASFVVIGIATETVDNAAGAAGDKEIEVLAGVEVELNATSIAQGSVGKTVHVVDDNTIDEAVGVNTIKAGKLTEVISATKGMVYIPPFGQAANF